jgi:VanZ family protein
MYDQIAGEVGPESVYSTPNKSTLRQVDGLAMVRCRNSPRVWCLVAIKFLSIVSRIAAWILVAVIAILSLVPHQLRPETGLPNNFEHAGIFAAAGAAFGLGYNRRPSLLMIGLVIFAGAIEIAQVLIPGRHARLSDFIVDTASMCATVMVGSIIMNRVLGMSNRFADRFNQ